MCGVGISDLPCLASGHNSNLISEYMSDLRRQGIAVDDKNDPSPPKKYSPLKNLLNTTGRGKQLHI